MGALRPGRPGRVQRLPVVSLAGRLDSSRPYALLLAVAVHGAPGGHPRAIVKIVARLTEQAWKANQAELLAMARRLRVASERVDTTAKRRHISAEMWKEWEDAAKEWREARDAMFGKAFDKSPDPHLAAIRAGDPGAVETAIRFLEADPNCFHAGYAKERFLRALKVVPLSPDQAHRLRLAMIHAVGDGYRHELEEWCRLAPNLDIDEVRAALSQMTDRGGDVGDRAHWSLDRIDEYLQTRQGVPRSKG